MDRIARFALGYQGRLSPLRADERTEALAWIAEQERTNVRILQAYLKDRPAIQKKRSGGHSQV